MDETQAIALAFDWYDSGHEDPDEFKEMIRVLFRSAVTTEREACAEVADFSGRWIGEWEKKYGSMSVAEAIRARSNFEVSGLPRTGGNDDNER